MPLNWKVSHKEEKMALREAAKLTKLPKIVTSRPKMPAGTATTPTLLSSFMEELTPHAIEWSKEYGILSDILRKQPDMAVGIRLFHSLHMTERGANFSKNNLMDLLEDVGSWVIN